MRGKNPGSNLFLLLCTFLLITACDQTFEPLREKDIDRFSMLGFLDASVDTQWVRITPLRHQLSQPAVKPGMNVTFEDLNNGSRSVMNDSLFLFPDGFHILNAWTTSKIEPANTYRLMAEGSGSGKSHVTVTIPEDFPKPQVIIPDEDLCHAVVTFKNVDRLADLQYRWFVKVTRPGWEYYRYFSFNYRNAVRQTAPGEYRLTFNLRNARIEVAAQMELFPENTTFEILEKQIYVASGGPEWIDFELLRSLDDLTYALPEAISNIENGVGYVVGIVSKTIPDTFFCS